MSRAKKATPPAQEEVAPPAAVEEKAPVVPREPFKVVAPAAEQPTDECVCSHHRQSHSGKGADKRCTSQVFMFGKCDCVSFRKKVSR